MEIEMVGTETVKPSSPTPPNKRSYNLSHLDQICPPYYVPIVIFYLGNEITPQQRLQKLKKSLSEALTRYYPLAGRLNGNISIECGDQGVEFVEARIPGLHLSTLLQNPDASSLERLFLPASRAEVCMGSSTPRLLVVQATSFECGGLGIGLCISHKFADAAALSRFLRDWALIAHKPQQLPPLDLGAALSYFPPQPTDRVHPLLVLDSNAPWFHNRETNRVVFDATKMAALKAIAASPSNPNPTRVEAAASLLWRCATNAAKTLMSRSSTSLAAVKKASEMHTLVNLRKRVVVEPPLSENSVGNMVLQFCIAVTDEEAELKDLVGLFRKGITDFTETFCGRKLGGADDRSEVISRHVREMGERFNRRDADVFMCTSWCNFKMYDADFGWGKPIWVAYPGHAVNNFFTLLDNRDGDGIEAFVTMTKEQMQIFLSHPLILQFSSLNPGVV